jgi:hypothetical protein
MNKNKKESINMAMKIHTIINRYRYMNINQHEIKHKYENIHIYAT